MSTETAAAREAVEEATLPGLPLPMLPPERVVLVVEVPREAAEALVSSEDLQVHADDLTLDGEYAMARSLREAAALGLRRSRTDMGLADALFHVYGRLMDTRAFRDYEANTVFRAARILGGRS